jgi:hypothetical protein
MTWIDARTSEVQQFGDPNAMTGIDNSSVDHEIVVNEFSGPSAVGQNAANGSRNQEHIIGSVVLKPRIHCTLIA